MRKNKEEKGNKEQLRLLCRKWQEFVSFFFHRLLVQTREMPGARSCTTGHHRFMRLSAALVMSKHNSLTHAHTDTHSDTDTGQTHNTRDSDSLIFLSIFFCFPNQLRVIVSGYLDWCFARKTKEVVLLMGSKRSSL